MSYLVMVISLLLGGGVGFLAAEYSPFYVFLIIIPIALSAIGIELWEKSLEKQRDKKTEGK